MHLAHLAVCKAAVTKYETREILILIASSLHHEAIRRKSTALHKLIQEMKVSVRYRYHSSVQMMDNYPILYYQVHTN